MNSQSETLPKIDFAAFRSKIALPGLVDSLEKGVGYSLFIFHFIYIHDTSYTS